MGEAAESTNQRLGGSLPVPIVQALADKSEVPDKYLRPEIDDEPIVSDVDVELPIVDLARLLDPQLYPEEAAKLENACEEWGFFQVNFLHKISLHMYTYFHGLYWNVILFAASEPWCPC